MPMTYRAQLRRNPWPDEILPAGLEPPQVMTDDDFACYAMFAKPTWAPVLLSFPQKYRLMALVLEEIRTHLGGHFEQLVMTCRVPGVMRFPNTYNAPDVFKVADLPMAVEQMQALGVPFLAMHEGFVRHPMEQGENEFVLTLYSQSPAAQEAFLACSKALNALGLEPDRQLAAEVYDNRAT